MNEHTPFLPRSILGSTWRVKYFWPAMRTPFACAASWLFQISMIAFCSSGASCKANLRSRRALDVEMSGAHGEARRCCPHAALRSENGGLCNLATAYEVGVDVCYSAKREVA